jgi:hypothetical protein
MVDVAVKCVKCGTQGVGNCDCWVQLRCPSCKRVKLTERHKTDPKGTEIVQVLCDKCDDGGGFPEVLYFDKAGHQLSIE